MKKRDYYETLGVQKTSTDKEIKSAYRKLAKKYHPDTNAGNKEAEKKFKEITEAYNVLSNEEKKKLYDSYGFAGLEDGFDPERYAGYSQGYSHNPFEGFQWESPDHHTYQEFHFTGTDGEDLFENLFGGRFHQGTGRRSSIRGRRGEDLTGDLTISFDESLKGCNKTVRIQEGQGSVSSISVSVPPGIRDGKTLRLKGKGYPGEGGGTNGDLLLQIHVTTKKGWERKENDLYVTVDIPFETAVLGGESIVPTLDGRVSVKIKPGTRSGTKIRLKGKGIQDSHHPEIRGDEYAVIQIDVPRNLSREKLNKLREYASA